MSEYEEPVTSDDTSGRSAPAPRQALAYVAGGFALLFAAGCAILLFLNNGARHSADEAAAARDASEAKTREAEEREHAAMRKLLLEVNHRETAEAKVGEADKARQKADRERDAERVKTEDALKRERAAVTERNEAQEREKRARTDAEVADGQRKEEAAQRREAVRQIVAMQVAHGTELLDDGDLPQALLWYVEALRGAHKERLPEEAHRLRLAIALSQATRPAQVWSQDKPPAFARLSPDGKQVAIADAEGVIHIWDAQTGKAVGDPINAGAPVASLLFSRDGKRLLGAVGEHVHAWDLATGKAAFSLEHEAPVTSVLLNADGKRLLTITGDGAQATLKVWDGTKGEVIGKPLDHAGSLVAMTFSADNREVLLAGTDKTIRRWNPVSGDTKGVALDQAGALVQASFSADGKRIVTAASDKTGRVWEVETGKPLTPPLRHAADITHVEFSPDGRRVVTVSKDNTARVWDAATGESPAGKLRHAETVTLAEFGPDGRHLLTASADGRLRLWDAATGDEMQRFWQGGPTQDAAFSLDGSAVLTVEGKLVRLWDLTFTAPPTPAVTEAAGQHWFSPDGKLVLRANGTTAQLSNTESGQPVGPPLKHKYPMTTAAFSGDGKRVLTMCREQGGSDPETLIQMWDTATGKEVGSPASYLHPVQLIALNHDGGVALTTAVANQTELRLRFYEPETGKQFGKEILFGAPVSKALFTPDGKFAITVMGNIVKMWDPKKAEVAGKSITHTGMSSVTQIVFSADGQRILTADSAGSVFVGEVGTGEEVALLPTQTAAVTYAAFSADGKRVVVCCADKTARVWELAKGGPKPVTPPLAHDAAPLAAFSPGEGRWLATAAGNRLRLWDAATGERAGPALLHSPDPAPITYLDFTADGKVVTGSGPAADPRGRRTWNLAADNRPLPDVEELVTLLTGRKLDGFAVAARPDDDVKKAWDALRPRYPDDFAPSLGRALAWARRGLDECERDKNWVGALRHLDRLIAADPARADLYLKRVAFHKALGQTGEMFADYQKAIEQSKDPRLLLSARAVLFAERGQWDKAAEDYTKVIEASPNDADAYAKRGRAYAERGQYDKAASDFSRAGPEGVADLRDLALARLGAGDVAGYKTVCARMAKRYGSRPADTHVVGWTCSLAPDALPDLKPLVDPAQQASAKNPKSRTHLLAVVGLLYRTGQFQPALQALEKWQPQRAANEAPTDWLLLALVQQKLGQAGEAKKWLDKATQAPAPVTAKEGWTWQDRLEVTQLLKEAEALVKAPK